ncbi:patatin-like phospholipase domain-containing protein 2 isoform X2 [Takifugu rubripes]|uniref:patatin-like phospholipase domain-containing protein 2 isoform X2 n=1 Tax=Takifugu rubripes TaxID=31033 RepID=UPI0011453D91|nr:patatin-like phospholipase domain-containing protein 2 isoform X2 [Takifugu rubripes]
MMFNWSEEWNLSFAGCGFRSVYYLGALSCFLDRVPQLVHGATRICGASSGCLVAAAVTVGIPIDHFCADVLNLARKVRKQPLGVFHPGFSLLQVVQDSLLEKLPADAHLRASGRLCVSLTRLADGKNVLVSQFDSREELIQVLICSCFFPVYCGFIPPSYRGELFLDGALSNNLPLVEQRNTITMAPFSGETDICPKDDAFNPIQVHCCSMSIQVNTRNVHRVCTSFLPPTIQNLAEICHSGYVDALRFLRDQDLITAQLHQPLRLDQSAVRSCCGPQPPQDDHSWLNPKVMENLPVSFQTACRVSHDGAGFPCVELLMYLLTLLLLPLELSFFLIKSMTSSGCAVIGRLVSQIRSQSGSCRSMAVQGSALQSHDSCNLDPFTGSGLSVAHNEKFAALTLNYRNKWNHVAGS